LKVRRISSIDSIISHRRKEVMLEPKDS